MGEALPRLTCSARGCHAAAVWALRWNNPSLHDPQRRKTWLACEEHRRSLSEFLGVRGFLREVEPAPASDPSTAPPAAPPDVEPAAEDPAEN